MIRNRAIIIMRRHFYQIMDYRDTRAYILDPCIQEFNLSCLYIVKKFRVTKASIKSPTFLLYKNFVKTKLYVLFFDLLLFHETKLHWTFEIYFFSFYYGKISWKWKRWFFRSTLLLLSWKQNYACTCVEKSSKIWSHFSVKSTFLLKKLLKSWFHGKRAVRFVFLKLFSGATEYYGYSVAPEKTSNNGFL